MSAVTQAQLSSRLLDQLQYRFRSRHPTGRLIYYDDCSSTHGWLTLAGAETNRGRLEIDNIFYLPNTPSEKYPSSSPNQRSAFRLWTPAVSANTSNEIVHDFPLSESYRLGMEINFAVPGGSVATPWNRVNSFEFGIEGRDGSFQYYTDVQYKPTDYTWNILNSSLSVVSNITTKQLYPTGDRLRWYNVKVVMDFTPSAPKYGNIFIEDQKFDMSGTSIQKVSNTDPPYFYAWFQIRDGTVPGDGYYEICDIYLTEFEP